MEDLRALRPGFCIEVRYKSYEHSGLAWKAVWEKNTNIQREIKFVFKNENAQNFRLAHFWQTKKRRRPSTLASRGLLNTSRFSGYQKKCFSSISKFSNDRNDWFSSMSRFSGDQNDWLSKISKFSDHQNGCCFPVPRSSILLFFYISKTPGFQSESKIK